MPDINVAQILEALNTKVDLVEGKAQSDIDYVVYTLPPDTDNEYKWVRLYKSGWVEQGGRMVVPDDGLVNITMPVEMRDLSYCIYGSTWDFSYTSGYFALPVFVNRTTTGFGIGGCSNNGSFGCCWEVKGFARVDNA